MHARIWWVKQSSRREWQNNMKTDIQKIVLQGVDWIDVAQNRDKWRAIL